MKPKYKIPILGFILFLLEVKEDDGGLLSFQVCLIQGLQLIAVLIIIGILSMT